MLARHFCYGTDAQRDTLRTLNITTMEDLLIATRLDVVCNVRNGRNPAVHNVHVPVFKKHLLGFMKHKCRGLFIDCDKLLDEKVVVTGGVYPQQWYAIATIHVTKSTGASAEPIVQQQPPPPPPIEILPTRVEHFNGSMSDDDAFAEALRRSVEAVPPSPVLKSTAACAPVDTNAHAELPFDEAPDELCCPITLALFVDPVQTIRGQTYERAAIEDWFTTHKTDPMTGETLITTAVYPDLVMKMVCDRQRAAPKQSSRDDKNTAGRPAVSGAGRGGRGGPRQATDAAGKGRGGRGKGGRAAGRGGRGAV